MKKPKILLYDFETSPILGYTWGKYDQTVLSIKKDWSILSLAWKWLGEKEVHCITKQDRNTDKHIVKKFASLLGQADIAIAHNGDGFDMPKAKARMIFHKLSPPQLPITIDTLKVAKSYFQFSGNRLEDLGVYLKLGRKAKHSGFDMWIGCMKNDGKSWEEMTFYNKKDVVLLEKVYERFRPWILNHPNIAKILGNDSLAACPNCSSKDVKKNGLRITNQQVKQRWDCYACGAKYTTRYVKGKVL